MTGTADLYDAHGDRLQIGAPLFRDFGGAASFSGEIATVKVFEDNTLVRSMLETQGDGRILVVDGGGSLRCALVGDQIGALAVANGWSGLVINVCIRDSRQLAGLPIGIKALAACPAKSVKRGEGQSQISVRFADIVFVPGHHLWADTDGIAVADSLLT
ncbi:MAG: ribonuclease E activity regulator RraA [Pseudomonadota bacterium]|nr:ribonuclease E activity regulator RraA [Pseudomonadota bacterium]